MATAVTTFKNYIGGEWVDAASGETFESASPATGEPLGSFPRSTAEDVDRAVAAAKAAYAEWRLVPAPERGTILLRFAGLLERDKAELTELMSREMGKVLAEAGGDVQEAIDMSIYMAGEGRRLFGHTTPSELRDKFQMSVRMPVGVVGAITPWNFPIAIPAWKLAPALVCGNTVVFKPAEDTPLLAERFIELLEEAGLPGRGRQPGPRLRRGGGRPPRPPSGRPGDHLHRLPRDRRAGDEERGGRAEARPPRARRQERDHRDGGRRPRPRGGGHRLVGVRHDRTAVHRGEPRDRARGGLRRAGQAPRRACRGDADRTRLGARHRPRAR